MGHIDDFTSPIIDLLRRSSLFHRLSDDDLHRVRNLGRRRQFARGETIMTRGEDGDCAYLIMSGRLKITNISADGQERVHNFIGPGEIVGEIALLDGGTRSANVVALDDGTAFVLWRRDLLPLLLDYPQALLAITEAVCLKLRMATDMLEDGAHQMASRLARGLVRLARRSEQHSGDLRIQYRLSQTDLGSYVGLSRSNVSRQLGQLKAAGILDIEGQEIIIRDFERLEELAEVLL